MAGRRLIRLIQILNDVPINPTAQYVEIPPGEIKARCPGTAAQGYFLERQSPGLNPRSSGQGVVE